MTDLLSPAAIERILLRQPTRRRVYDAIRERPGEHVRSLSRALETALGSVEHHVRQLERHGLVFAHQAGRRRTLYASIDVDARDAATLHILAKPVWRRILARLADVPEENVVSMARALGVPASSLSYHLGRLRSLGIVDVVQVGRERIHVLVDTAILRRLRPHPWVGLIERAEAHAEPPVGGIIATR